MEKRSVILITFLFITRCFSEASKKHLESSKYSEVFFFLGRQRFAWLLWREGILWQEGRLLLHLQWG